MSSRAFTEPLEPGWLAEAFADARLHREALPIAKAAISMLDSEHKGPLGLSYFDHHEVEKLRAAVAKIKEVR